MSTESDLHCHRIDHALATINAGETPDEYARGALVTLVADFFVACVRNLDAEDRDAGIEEIENRIANAGGRRMCILHDRDVARAVTSLPDRSLGYWAHTSRTKGKK